MPGVGTHYHKHVGDEDTVSASTDDNLRRWKVRERLVDDSRMVRMSIAEVELPDGVRFEQFVMRMPRAAIVAVVNDQNEILMIERHRFIIDRVVWELPGGYVHGDDDPAETAACEVEEETGWRPAPLELLLSFQPMVGSADSENHLYLARGAEYIGQPSDINEAERVEWVPLDSALQMIERGAIVGSASIIAVLYLRATATHR